MNNAPIREPVGDGWTPSWDNYFQQITQRLNGWVKSYTTTLTYDFGLIGAQSESSTTATVSGAMAGDAVIVTPLANTAGIFYSGIATSTNTVTIYAKNFTGSGINPASTTFRIIVLQN